MNKRIAIILSAVAIAVLLVVVAYLITEKGKEGRGREGEQGKDTTFKDLYPDAPNPADDPELAEQIKTLWPDVAKPKPDRDVIRKEWADFAKKYPKNIYIPDEFRGPLSEDQANDRRKLLDTVTGIETRIAAQRGAAKNARPGDPAPAAPGQPNVTPAEQHQYFDYKIQELESRIQLVQYMLENSTPSAEDKNNALADLAKWNKQLEEFKATQAKIPG